MPAKKKWSHEVTEHSDALALEPEVFKSDDPREIAKSLKKSAEESHKRKSEPYRSAMSMLYLLHQPRRQEFASKAQAGA